MNKINKHIQRAMQLLPTKAFGVSDAIDISDDEMEVPVQSDDAKMARRLLHAEWVDFTHWNVTDVDLLVQLLETYRFMLSQQTRFSHTK